MYSPRIIQRNAEKAEAQFDIKLKRYDVGFCQDARERLDSLRKEDGSLKRQFTKAEKEFIRNEALMSKFDFRYWCSRYCTIDRDGAVGGGIGNLELWESQELILDVISQAESEEYEKFDRGEQCDGILLHNDKARQEGLTGISRALTMHRVLFYHNTRAFAASVDEDKIKELYDRDKKIYNCGLEKDEYSNKGGLPYWMRPALSYDVKAGHLTYALLGSNVLYQFSTQGSALGQGRQFDIGHCTEMAYWPEQVLATMQRDFFPTLPQSPRTLFLSESVAFGRSGWWYEMSKMIRAERLVRWRHCFIPWYIISKKYNRTPPADWLPNEITQRHADMVWETSLQLVGRRVTLTREKMYWWETTREEFRQQDDLGSFLTNFAATPEEGFQHSNPTVISLDTLSRCHDEAAASHPVPYLLRLSVNGKPTRSSSDDWTKGKVPVFSVGQDAIVPMHPDELDDDARGIVWMWEPPKRGGTYAMAIDPSLGRVGWDRNSRTSDDYRTDNGCIQIVRKGREEGAPDVQCCEFAAPMDQESLGEVANLLGRIYGGHTEDGQALAVTEVHLGLGLSVQRKLLDCGYTNLWRWETLDKFTVNQSQSFGWYASPSSVKILWEKIRRHITLRKVVIKSKWLVEELQDVIWDAGKHTANAAQGSHDDRVRALGIGIWALHSWGAPETVSTGEVNATERKKVDWQRSSISYEDMNEEANDLVEEWLETPFG